MIIGEINEKKYNDKKNKMNDEDFTNKGKMKIYLIIFMIEIFL